MTKDFTLSAQFWWQTDGETCNQWLYQLPSTLRFSLMSSFGSYHHLCFDPKSVCFYFKYFYFLCEYSKTFVVWSYFNYIFVVSMIGDFIEGHDTHVHMWAFIVIRHNRACFLCPYSAHSLLHIIECRWHCFSQLQWSYNI